MDPARGIDVGRKPFRQQAILVMVVVLPFAAVLGSYSFADLLGISWQSIAAAAVMYVICMLGITVGFHRHFSHRSFRASRALKVALGIAGSLAIQGPILHWAADHRRHHAFSDREGDPHSPWEYGSGFWPLIRGMLHAHVGWLFDVDETRQAVFVPDLLGDPDVVVIDRLFGVFAAVSAFGPSVLAVLLTGSPVEALKVFFYVGLLRIFLVHHVTWSVNSLCHVFGSRPFSARDKSANFWPLAVLSMGESWHNGHHWRPYSARHGLLRGQVDPSAFVIKEFERLGWATDAKWLSEDEVAAGREWQLRRS